ncbi:peptide chain release factor N(5)-glutamine methyltransferase [Profundibacterium mesophilum]|uniref:Release factor glutamine methyltransferase n=1 Tax=Profundibacterium mesophilum KAUST100406-0324 TaxID=1037889 RepID=A0A921TE14_9RHOB|nr:peptide chain release factor N(5)-glutamine methyltransferase [Profundibacterium mesophilum]KAF0674924.1 Release factor glutamine methyltransferase [Profundibacterium mesophilum KAUST100406-0324]
MSDTSGPRLADLLRVGAARLREAGIDEAGGDARHLLAAAAGIARDRLSLHLGDGAPEGADARFAALLARRANREPVSRLLGRRFFFGRDFAVTPDVLDPRPETEILVAAALDGPVQQVLDLGTGSGCILVSLLAERPDARGTGTDLSEAALGVARGNAERHGVAARCAFRQADWLEGIEGAYDTIVSNPPYIARDEMAGLAPEVSEHDPHLALSPGGDGLAAYRRITAAVPARLAPGGRLLVEIGPTQGAAVRDLFAGAGLTRIAVLRDLDGRDRVVSGRLTT